MRRIKIFSSENDAQWLERQVNEWLAEHKTAIIHNLIPSEVIDQHNSHWYTITIFYYEGEQGQ